MALSAAPVTPSWNPLRCGGTDLPVNVLLTAKLIALGLILTRHISLVPDPYLPFLPIFDAIQWPRAFQLCLRVTMVVSALALLFNLRVRISALILGLTILVGMLSSRLYYGNNRLICVFLLILAALYDPRAGLSLLRWQIAIVYFGAGLNKLLDADWRSGQYMEYWLTTLMRTPLYVAAASLAPSMWVAKLTSWGTIVIELALPAAFLVRRWFAAGILLSLLFQSALMLITGSTYNMFFYVMQASLLLFVDWPKSKWLVIYDGDCGFCARSRDFFMRFDFEGLLDWRPYQSGVGTRYGVTDQQASERVYLVAGDKIFSGFRAIRLMLLYNPVTYFAILTLLAAPGGYAVLHRRIVATLLLIFFLPIFAPLWERVYMLIARNRHKLSATSSCSVSPQ